MNERVSKLRQQSVNAMPYISMERARIVTETYKKYQGTVSVPVLRALTFKNIMENKKLCINDGELIVGERGESPAATPTYPELCCHTIEDLEIMDKRDKISFKVSDEAKKFQENVIIPFWENRAMRHIILNEMDKEWYDIYEAGIITEFMEQRAPGHTVCDDKIYKKGFLDFKADIKAELDKLDFINDMDAYHKKSQLEAMYICCDAIITLAERYASLAEKMAQEEKREKRKKELIHIAENCRWVPAHAPRTFEEALQMYWFVHIGVITELNTWDSFCPGRLDQHLYPFYKREIEEGSLTEEKAKELLECFWVKFNNQPAPPKVGITLEESGTYTDFCNINIGGLTKEGRDGVNDVTYLILDVIEDMRLLQPSSNLQVSSLNPDEFIKRACKILKTGFGQPSIFNADVVIQEMLRVGKSIEDARCGGTSGCVETGAFGKEAYILTGYLNLPKILEITLNNGIDIETGKKLGLETGDPTTFETYEELFNAYKKQIKHFVDIKIRGNQIIEKLYADKMPAPFMSVVISDCIKKAKDYNAGGARYNTRYIQGVGIGTITDSLTAIKYHVYDKKNIGMEEMLNALKYNFEGHELVYNLVRNKTPKYGNDDDYADDIMQSVFNAYYDAVDGKPTVNGGIYRIDMLPTTCHVYFGKVMGASPDGRKAHEPLSEGISPSKGADRLGPTAVVKSASKMDHVRTGGTLLNQKFLPSVFATEEGLDNLVHLIRAYFKLGGHHIQFNVVDKQTLIAAQKEPEKYKNLIVRVAGYSDYFCNLNKVLQDEIINRTEQSFN
ncbi:benzylsuccinate synthase alpha subunit [Clostridium tepidiprofundi DSM 19306]|uniref:Benzylsuccinate synthase alpha subunit n=1 Tax=Clostridium tepidiprofundi DSM 19306 TaxID=1121338 RepID=A0A151B7S6_9CLOT|nr:trans-4-hydroxy-L-proline dehydratase [Clostridium tepidiprofundi]KYH35975.1 benzylsuccinate synthase alpha subunit [Clostridium tepidiprofundi DSM 19306]